MEKQMEHEMETGTIWGIYIYVYMYIFGLSSGSP